MPPAVPGVLLRSPPDGEAQSSGRTTPWPACLPFRDWPDPDPPDPAALLNLSFSEPDPDPSASFMLEGSIGIPSSPESF